MKLKHLASVIDGRVTFKHKDRFLEDAKRYEGKAIEVTMKEYQPNRSNPLNQYYWGVVIKLLSEYTGFNKDDTHELMKGLYLRTKKEVNGKLYDTVKSTTKINNKQMIIYIEKIKQFAAEELQVYIPDPHESIN
tara:strand:- start:215 stop:616 length:402 start_codon:yes stop_codon:yes gene_type:complete